MKRGYRLSISKPNIIPCTAVDYRRVLYIYVDEKKKNSPKNSVTRPADYYIIVLQRQKKKIQQTHEPRTFRHAKYYYKYHRNELLSRAHSVSDIRDPRLCTSRRVTLYLGRGCAAANYKRDKIRTPVVFSIKLYKFPTNGTNQ